MSGPLSGVRILEFSEIIAAPFAGMILSDMDAEVIKVEPPWGEPWRHQGAFMPTESRNYISLNRGKRSLPLDLTKPEGRKIVYELIGTTDVVLINYRPDTPYKLGIDYETLSNLNPRLIYCHNTAFGLNGPDSYRPGYDIIAQAMSGIMSFTGVPDTPPVKAGVPIADMNAGMFSVYGILSAYIHKLKTGEGQYLEISLLEAALAYTVWESAGYFATGEVAGPLGSSHRNSAPYQALKTKDGHIVVGAPNQPNWERLANVFSRADLIERDEYKDNASRLVNRADLEAELESTTNNKTTGEWLEALEEAGVPAGPILNMEQIWADPQVQDRGMEAALEHPTAGTIKNIGLAAKLYGTPGRITEPAPLLAQHTREVLLGAGYTADDIEVLVKSGAAVVNDI